MEQFSLKDRSAIEITGGGQGLGQVHGDRPLPGGSGYRDRPAMGRNGACDRS